MAVDKKICHIVLSLAAGGLEKIVCDLAMFSAKKGSKVCVCCLDERGVLANKIEQMGSQVFVVKRKPGFDLRLILILFRLFRREMISVVHTHNLDPMFYAGIAAWMAKVPVRIHTHHDVMLRDYCWKDKLKFFLAARCFNAVVAVSQDTRRALEPYCISDERQTVILNGIDESRFARRSAMSATDTSRGTVLPASYPNKDNAGAWMIGTVARLSPEKGIRYLLEAFSEVAMLRSGARLIIVGDGPERSNLQTYAEKLGVGSLVNFLGYQRKIEELLPQFDLFVLPSLTEGIPLALLEAMAARVPVIATAVGGVPEVVIHKESGILVHPGNPDALRDAILGIMENSAERERMALNGERRIHQHFGLSAMARAYTQLYLREPQEYLWKRAVKRYLLQMFSQRWMIWRGSPRCLDIALTFADGPDPAYTPPILDILKQFGAKATFFVIGKKAEKHRDLVKRIIEEGHEIGNHSFTHPEFDRLSWKEARAEITRAQIVLGELQGRSCSLFRPPFGKLCLASILGAWLKRMTIVMWSIDLKDFRANDQNEVIAALTVRPMGPGDIVLYHGDNMAALAALPTVIESALQRGRKIVPVSRMLYS
jgi:glycosyltransferase involved in cell wall biosynthesis/peptidoglycan/xylan/chitin deacetylase (PgdA/CDA1 family)